MYQEEEYKKIENKLRKKKNFQEEFRSTTGEYYIYRFRLKKDKETKEWDLFEIWVPLNEKNKVEISMIKRWTTPMGNKKKKHLRGMKPNKKSTIYPLYCELVDFINQKYRLHHITHKKD